MAFSKWYIERADTALMVTRKLLGRMGSGNDAIENLGLLLEDHSWFIVKRKLRRECK